MKKIETTTDSRGTSTTMTISVSNNAIKPQEPCSTIIYNHNSNNHNTNNHNTDNHNYEDFYTKSRNSWNYYTSNIPEFTPPVLSRIEKVIIWKSNSCFPYLNELYGDFAAYYFIGYLNKLEYRDTLNNTMNNILDKSLCYILSSCYFHTLLELKNAHTLSSTIINTFEFYFKNIKKQKHIYNPLEQIVSISKNNRANILYQLLCSKNQK